MFFFMPEVKDRTLEEIDEMVRLLNWTSFDVILTDRHSSRNAFPLENSAPTSALVGAQ